MAKAIKKQTAGESGPNPHRPNFWGMCRDVLLAALNKGQMLPAFLGLIVIIIVIKMPPADLKSFSLEILQYFKTFHIWGWVLAGVILTVSSIMIRRNNRLHNRETNRLNKRNTELTNTIIEKHAEDSNQKLIG